MKGEKKGTFEDERISEKIFKNWEICVDGYMADSGTGRARVRSFLVHHPGGEPVCHAGFFGLHLGPASVRDI